MGHPHNSAAPHIISVTGPSQGNAVPFTTMTRGDPVPDRRESVRLMLGIGTRRRWRKGEAGQIGYARRWGDKQACNIFV